jgi:hypothetical protein
MRAKQAGLRQRLLHPIRKTADDRAARISASRAAGREAHLNLQTAGESGPDGSISSQGILILNHYSQVLAQSAAAKCDKTNGYVKGA